MAITQITHRQTAIKGCTYFWAAQNTKHTDISAENLSSCARNKTTITLTKQSQSFWLSRQMGFKTCTALKFLSSQFVAIHALLMHPAMKWNGKYFHGYLRFYLKSLHIQLVKISLRHIFHIALPVFFTTVHLQISFLSTISKSSPIYFLRTRAILSNSIPL